MCALYFKSSDCCSEAIFSRRGEKRKYELVYRYRELKKKGKRENDEVSLGHGASLKQACRK